MKLPLDLVQIAILGLAILFASLLYLIYVSLRLLDKPADRRDLDKP